MFTVTAIIKAKKGHGDTMKQALLDVATHVSSNEPDQIPIYDPLFTAANMPTGQNVSSVIIDGNIVMKERMLLSMDIEKIKANLAQRLPIIMDRFEEVMK